MPTFSPETYTNIAQRSILETVSDYHLTATSEGGRTVVAPASFQINQPGFSAFLDGKGSPGELQDELDRQTALSPINNDVELHELMTRTGIGIDCSMFAFTSLRRIHTQLGLPDYTSTVFRSSSDVLEFHATRPRWQPKDASGIPRALTADEYNILSSQPFVSAAWICETLGTKPERIIGSQHMAAPEAAQAIKPEDTLPGDLVAFAKTPGGSVSHVAIVDEVEQAGDQEITINYWHPLRMMGGGQGRLRRDSVTLTGDIELWTPDRFNDLTREGRYYFCRPNALAELYASAT